MTTINSFDGPYAFLSNFYQPDEGGVACPDCTPKGQGETL